MSGLNSVVFDYDTGLNSATGLIDGIKFISQSNVGVSTVISAQIELFDSANPAVLYNVASSAGTTLLVGTNETSVVDLSICIFDITQAQRDAIITNYSAAQEAIIFSLTLYEQTVFASGTDADKQAIIDTLTPEQQAVFAGVPTQFSRSIEQIAADKLRMEQIVNKLKSNQFINDDDSVFYALGNSLMATCAMAEIDAGRGFDGLRNIGLTQTQALKVLSIYNVTIDTGKYESELALAALENDPAKIVTLQAYLAGLTPPLTLPPITPYLGSIRANHTVYAAVASWTP